MKPFLISITGGSGSGKTYLANQLLNKNVLTRINNSTLYGNKYNLTSYMIDLRNAIFKTDLPTGSFGANGFALDKQTNNKVIR